MLKLLTLTFLLFASTLAALAQLRTNLDCNCGVVGGGGEFLCKCTEAKTEPAQITQAPAQNAAAPKAAPVAATATPASVAPSGAPTGTTTTKGQEIYTGPGGGRYHYSDSGKKVYERRKK